MLAIVVGDVSSRRSRREVLTTRPSRCVVWGTAECERSSVSLSRKIAAPHGPPYFLALWEGGSPSHARRESPGVRDALNLLLVRLFGPPMILDEDNGVALASCCAEHVVKSTFPAQAVGVEANGLD